MADKKISQLTNLTGANLADDDEFVLVDTSADETKAITYGELKKFNSIDINGGTIDGTVIGGATPAAGSFTTGSFTGDVSFGDNDKAIFGAGSDLHIFHNGSSSYIRDTGAGNLILDGSNLQLRGYTTSESFLEAIENGGVTLFYNNGAKIATTSTGVDVTGTITSDGLTVGLPNNTGNTLFYGGAQPDRGLEVGVSNAGGFDNSAWKISAIAPNSGSTITLATRDTDRLKLASNGDISFYEDTGTTPKFFWDASAESLGIGTTSPTQALDVSGNMVSNGRLILTNAGSSADTGSVSVGTLSGSFYANTPSGKAIYHAVAGQAVTYSDANRHWFRTAGTERLRIDLDGNVGIGTSSPEEMLHVDGGNMKFTNTVSNDSRIYFTHSTSANRRSYIGALETSGTGNSLIFAPNANGFDAVEAMRIDSSGSLLVGTTVAASNKMHLAFDNSSQNGMRFSHASGTYTNPAIVFVNAVGTTVGSIKSTGTATTYNTSSDYRLKTDIQGIDNPADRLMSLKPCNFEWKADGTRTDGFIAHEAQAVVPEAVTGTKDGDEMQAIDQSKLVPLLTAALQEALTEIDALETRITALEG